VRTSGRLTRTAPLRHSTSPEWPLAYATRGDTSDD
jgi:hypothetical protein